MNYRKVKILGTGKYIPNRVVLSEELDRKLNLEIGTCEKKSGVYKRHYIENETAIEMAKKASLDAIENANISLDDIDLILGTSGTYQQPIPSNASLLQKELGLGESGIPCFDINSTCLSFVVGVDTISYLIDSGKYKNVLLVSTEISSCGLNWNQLESCVLFGDGAAAAVLSFSSDNSKILSSHLETYGYGAHFTEIRGGGNLMHASKHNDENYENYLFNMDGRNVFKIVYEKIENFVEKLLDPIGLKISDIDMFIPHQASLSAMNIIRKKLNIDEDKFMYIIKDYGNMISASVPLALNLAIEQKRVKRGDKIMLLGTSAGTSFGGVVFEY